MPHSHQVVRYFPSSLQEVVSSMRTEQQLAGKDRQLANK